MKSEEGARWGGAKHDRVNLWNINDNTTEIASYE